MAGVLSLHLCSKQASSYVCQLVAKSPKHCKGFTEQILKNSRCTVQSRSQSTESRDSLTVENRNLVEQSDSLYRERFVPLTRRTTVSYLLQDELKLTTSEKKEFEKFSVSLDAVISNRYSATLQELKQLFEPISPDKDTVSTRQISSHDRQENEFWLLQRFGQVMEKANFYELTDSEIRSKLSEHELSEGVRISVNLAKYDVLKFWVLGKESLPTNHSLVKKLTNLVLGHRLSTSATVYKRVISAVRLKNDDKLTLKIFKDVSVDDLEKLLPVMSITIGKFDKYMILSSITLTSLAILAKIVTLLAKLKVSWPLLFAGFSSLIGVKGYWAYRSKQNKYLYALNRTLYYKNIANNRGLITLIIDRAQDESFKEALLTYTFVHAMSRGHGPAYMSIESSPGQVTSIALENAIEQWVFEKTGSVIEFDSAESISILEKVGILSVEKAGVSQTLSVLPLEQAYKLLPQTPLSILTRVDESDVTEGYDRSKYEIPDQSGNGNYLRFTKMFKR